MNLNENEKQAVNELVKGLKKLYGDNLTRVILYGSKARGESQPDSDIDILAVLKEMGSNYDEIGKINEVAAPLSLKYDIVLSVLPKKEERFNESYKTIFIHNVLSEGVSLL